MALISLDSKFMKFMERLVDVLVLNLLWLLFSLPLVTLGASTAAAFAVTLRMVDDEEGPVFREFWAAFRATFGRATGLWALQALGLYALYLDSQLLGAADPPLLLLVVSIVSIVFLIGAFVYAYALLARYHSQVGSALQNSLKISFRYWGRTLLLVLLLALELAVFSWNTTMLFFGVLVGPMILIYTVSGLAKRTFQSLEVRP